MGRSFRGESVHKVDGKGRVSIPASFRRVLEDGDSDFPETPAAQLVLVWGVTNGECLEGYSMAGMAGIDARIAALPPYSEERERLEYMFNTQSSQSQLDETGRIVLPARLREMIGVGDEAVFAGMNEKFQIWAPKAFEAKRREIENRISGRDGKAAALALLGRALQKD